MVGWLALGAGSVARGENVEEEVEDGQQDGSKRVICERKNEFSHGCSIGPKTTPVTSTTSATPVTVGHAEEFFTRRMNNHAPTPAQP